MASWSSKPVSINEEYLLGLNKVTSIAKCVFNEIDLPNWICDRVWPINADSCFCWGLRLKLFKMLEFVIYSWYKHNKQNKFFIVNLNLQHFHLILSGYHILYRTFEFIAFYWIFVTRTISAQLYLILEHPSVLRLKLIQNEIRRVDTIVN